MKVTIIGAGSAGLAVGIFLRRRLGADVTILERASEDEAPGLGIALLPFGLNELKLMELDGFADFEAACIPIGSVTQVFAGPAGGQLLKQARVQEMPYWGLRRAALLAFLRRGAADAGIAIDYGADVSETRVREEKERTDLLIGADGAGSAVRAAFASAFAPDSRDATTRFAWLEMAGRLEQFVFGYVFLPEGGLIRITAYPHAPTQSSAIVTHARSLVDYFDGPGMLDAEGGISPAAMATLNDIFARGVGGRPLHGASRWRRLRITSCRRAVFENVALVGDAFATVHYETGWGTSAALQEARLLGHILARTVGNGGSIAAALELYDRKAFELSAGLIEAARRTMEDVDGQSDRFAALGPARFLELKTA